MLRLRFGYRGSGPILLLGGRVSSFGLASVRTSIELPCGTGVLSVSGLG